MGFGGRERTVLVMWEHSAEHSPIWSRSADLEIGNHDARDLGLSEALRDALAEWNRRVETAADPSDLLDRPVAAAQVRGREVEAFGLAARVQRELADDWTVWCLAGGGDGGMRDRDSVEHLLRTSGPQFLLRDGGLVHWTAAGTEPGSNAFPPGLRREVRAWRSRADRRGPAEHRAQALELAGRLHEALDRGRVLWFGGAGVPS